MVASDKLAALVGTPFRYGGRGPDAFDCYGLVMHIHALRGVELPDFGTPQDRDAIPAHMATVAMSWKQVGPGPHTVVLFRAGRTLHVGYTLPGDKFIHTWESSGGVVIERLSQWAHRIVGYYQYV